LSRIFKHFMNPNPEAYIFQEVSELKVEDDIPELPSFDEEPEQAEPEEMGPIAEPQAPPPEPEPEPEPQPDPLEYAQIQAQAILRDAEREAARETEEYRQKALHDLEDELDELRREAREEGYRRGLTEGLAEGHAQARTERAAMAQKQAGEIKAFLEDAVAIRDRIYNECREELKDLALAVAEKVIRISLRGSSDILLRMIESATDKHKRCEWAQIYIADCDVKTMAYTIPELTAALAPIANRVRVIPMAGDDSGSCIIELPDVIIDASVSTQLRNMKEILDNAALDKNG